MEPAISSEARVQRAHNPEALGSRVYLKDGLYHIDLRWRGGGRPRLRDPHAAGWPERGPTTGNQETAERWGAIYDARWREERDREAADREELEQRRTGRYQSLGIAVPAFLDHRKDNKEPSTVAGSRTATTHLLEYFGERLRPEDVRSEDLQGMFKRFTDQGYSSRTVNGYLNHLMVFFDFLKIEPNPARAVSVAKPAEAADEDDEAGAENDIQPWDAEQRAKIRNAADQIDLEATDGVSRRLLVEYLFTHGVRLQEAAAAEWERIDSRSKTARVPYQISRKSGQRKRTKGKKPRTTLVLEEWWPFHREGAKGLLFAGKDGRPIPYRKLYDIVKEILEVAELKKPGVAAHQFRHTYAWLFLDRGMSIEHLQKCLGHKRLSTTQEYYDHFSSDHAAKAAARKMYGKDGEKSSIKRGPREK